METLINNLEKAKYLIIDTETNGFPKQNVADTSKAQARVCQFCLMMLDEDFNVLLGIGTLLKPEGKWTMPDNVAAIHGFTTEICEKDGIPHNEFIERFTECLAMAPNLKYLIAHNLSFDERMLQIELAHAGLNEALKDRVELLCNKIATLKPRCTMEHSTDICKIAFKDKKPHYGKRYKWPTLQEAYNFFFQRSFEGAHNAINDVKACAEIYQHLVKNQYIIE